MLPPDPIKIAFYMQHISDMHYSAPATKTGAHMLGIHQERAAVTVAINCYNLDIWIMVII